MSPSETERRENGIDYVSPLPPVRSGIADYSRDLLAELGPRCDLRVVELPDQPLSDEIRGRWPTVPAERCGEEGRLPLYQMGNNRHHLSVLALALERPGVVTLHDLVLHHLLVERTLATEDIAAYREQLVADHGWVGEMTARARRWGELGSAPIFELPAHRSLVRRQRGVLVHSRWAAERVIEECGEVAVRVVPMAMPLGERPDEPARLAFRRRFGLPADRPLLGTFGFQTPIKRTEVVIDALARPELADAHLVIAGEVSRALDLEGRVRRAGLEERVHITGFLDYDDFLTAIGACDLCVNLRYPTAGETSASLLRVLAVGCGVVVSDYAQFAELPDAFALKVPLGEGEIEALALGAAELLGDPGRLERMAAAARRYVDEGHRPADAARAVVAACAELATLEPPPEEAVEVPAPTTLTWLRLEGALTVDGAEAPWGRGESRRLSITLSNEGFGRWSPTEDEIGGVLVELQWRDHPEGGAVARQWAELPREIGPGESWRFDLETRRPPAGEALVIEPHVVGVSGFSSLGGPRWVMDLGA